MFHLFCLSSRQTTKVTNSLSKSSTAKSHLCTASKSQSSSGPPLRSRISSFEANKVTKASKCAPARKNGKNVKTEIANRDRESDNLYAQIRQFLDEKKSASERNLSLVSTENVKSSKGSNHFVLLGDVTKPLPKTSKVVRLFTSSTFTGTSYVDLCLENALNSY